MYFVLLVLLPCISSHDFTDSCEISPQAEDASDFTKLIDYLNHSVNYKVDPCENFYQFACGNWIANANGTTLMNWEEISPFTKMENLFEQEKRKVLNSTEQSTSDAITHARKFYHSCVRAEGGRDSTGVSGIDHVMGKIEKFGIFPMLSEEPFDEAQFNAKFDFTWLLAYFNQDEIVMDVIVPEIVEIEDEKMISMKLIAADRGINYYKTKTPSDILALRKLMKKIYALSTASNLQKYLDSGDSPFMNLNQVDETYKNERLYIMNVFEVNWTEYLLLTAPPIAHPYIAEDPRVVTPGEEYTEKLNKVLRETSPRTLTNFVVIHYILRRLELLERKYIDLLEWFIAIIDSPQRFTRSGVCFTMTNTYYPVAMLAMYARSQHTEVLRPMAEEMVRAIITAFKNEIQENRWMEKSFKEAVTGKINRITWSLLDDDLFHNDTALDDLYAAEYGLSDLPFLEILEKVTLIRKTKVYLRLTSVELERPDPKKFSTMGYKVNAFYQPYVNNISRMYNEYGEKQEWWEKKWTEEYDKKTLCYRKQYDNVKIPKFNISLNGTLTLGENIADNEGIKIAYRAYKKYATKLNSATKSEHVDGFTQNQLFFLGFSQIWCRKKAEFTQYEELFYEHAPNEFRSVMCPRRTPKNSRAALKAAIDRFIRLSVCIPLLAEVQNESKSPVLNMVMAVDTGFVLSVI